MDGCRIARIRSPGRRLSRGLEIRLTKNPTMTITDPTKMTAQGAARAHPVVWLTRSPALNQKTPAAKNGKPPISKFTATSPMTLTAPRHTEVRLGVSEASPDGLTAVSGCGSSAGACVDLSSTIVISP